jgi:hypothetical protein
MVSHVLETAPIHLTLTNDGTDLLSNAFAVNGLYLER